MGEIEEMIEIGIMGAKTEGGGQDRGIERRNAGIGADYGRGTAGDTEMATGAVSGIGGTGSGRQVGRGIEHGEVGRTGISRHASGVLLIYTNR